jgi:baculoviral IAP repeat-containing protein 7/8
VCKIRCAVKNSDPYTLRFKFLEIKMNFKRIFSPEYKWESNRVHTFNEWPIDAKKSKLQLAQAGFYYTGKGDRVICFSCGGGFKDWEEDNDPWEKHAKYYSECEYLKLMKGEGFINSVKESQFCASESKIKRSDQHQNNDRLCKICLTQTSNTAFIPCGHVIACKSCAGRMHTCPYCRTTYEQIQNLYFV